MNVSEHIKKLRKAKDFTQATVAEALGMTSQNYNLLENGKTELTYSKIIKLAEIFGVSVVELLGEGASVVVVGGGEGAKEMEAMKAKLEALEREVKDLREILQFTKKSFYDMAGFQIGFLSVDEHKKEMEKIYAMSIPEVETYVSKLFEDYKNSMQSVTLSEKVNEKYKATFKLQNTENE